MQPFYFWGNYNYKHFCPQGTPVQLHSPAHGLDHGKIPPTQMGLSWMDHRKMGEWTWLDTLILPLLPWFRNTCFFLTVQLFAFSLFEQQVHFLS